MTNTTMTRKAFFEAAATFFNASESSDAKALAYFAEEELRKMNEATEKRRNKPTKAALANAPLADAIVKTILADGATKLTTEITAALRELFPEMEISTQKTSGILRNLVNAGTITQEKIKVTGKGEQAAYTLAATDEEEAE